MTYQELQTYRDLITPLFVSKQNTGMLPSPYTGPTEWGSTLARGTFRYGDIVRPDTSNGALTPARLRNSQYIGRIGMVVGKVTRCIAPVIYFVMFADGVIQCYWIANLLHMDETRIGKKGAAKAARPPSSASIANAAAAAEADKNRVPINTAPDIDPEYLINRYSKKKPTFENLLAVYSGNLSLIDEKANSEHRARRIYNLKAAETVEEYVHQLWKDEDECLYDYLDNKGVMERVTNILYNIRGNFENTGLKSLAAQFNDIVLILNTALRQSNVTYDELIRCFTPYWNNRAFEDNRASTGWTHLNALTHIQDVQFFWQKLTELRSKVLEYPTSPERDLINRYTKKKTKPLAEAAAVLIL